DNQNAHSNPLDRRLPVQTRAKLNGCLAGTRRSTGKHLANVNWRLSNPACPRRNRDGFCCRFQEHNMLKSGLAFMLLVSATAALASPATVSDPSVSPSTDKPTDIDELDTFMDVYERVKAKYVRDVDPHTLVKGAIEGMLAALDPHSSYEEGSDFDDLQTITDGDYGGL